MALSYTPPQGSGGGGGPSIGDEKYVRTTRFEQISSGTSGTVTLPSSSTVVLDDFGGTVDAIVTQMSGGKPLIQSALDASGQIVATSFDSSGNWVFTGTPSAYPVALVYRVQQKLKDFDDTATNIIGAPIVSNAVWGTIAGTLSNQTDLSSALGTKAPLNSPTFTGTVSGITSTMVGLGNVANVDTRQMSPGITLDGGGVAITTGSKGYISIPYDCTVASVTLLADQSGSIVIDIKKSTYSGFPTTTSICASAKPTLSAARKSVDSTLTGWTTTISAGDILEYVVDSASTVTRVHLILEVVKT